MNIISQSFVDYSNFYLKFDFSSLTQKKKILAIASLALSFLAASYLVVRGFYYMGERLGSEPEDFPFQFPLSQDDEEMLDSDRDKKRAFQVQEMENIKSNILSLENIHREKVKENQAIEKERRVFADRQEEGTFEKDQLKGWGKITFFDGLIEEGEFQEGQLHGIGMRTDPATGNEIGEFQNGELHGLGKKIFDDGGKEEGRFQFGKLHGRGMIIYPDGGKDEGEFQNGDLHGHGKRIFADGRKEEGEFQEGKLHGQGKRLFAEGGKEEGKFHEGELHGQGTRTFLHGEKEEGEFRHNYFFKSVRPQIPIAKQQVTSTDVIISPYISLNDLQVYLNNLGPNSEGLTEPYVGAMRKRIFGFSIGQKKAIKELCKGSQLSEAKLMQILERDFCTVNLLYLFLYLKQFIAGGESQQHSSYFKWMQRLFSVVERSLPFAFISFIPSDQMDQMVKDMMHQLKTMEPQERLLIPLPIHDHVILLVIQKIKKSLVTVTVYNTSGIVFQTQNGLNMATFNHWLNSYKNTFPISLEFPSIDVNHDEALFESMMLEIFELVQTPITQINGANSQLYSNLLDILVDYLGSGVTGPVKQAQINGVCSFQILMEAIKGMPNSQAIYPYFEVDFLTHLQEEFQDITDAMKTLLDEDEELKSLYPLHCLLLKENQAQIDKAKAALQKMSFYRA